MRWFNIPSRPKSIPLSLLLVLVANRGLCQTPILNGERLTPPGIVPGSNPALQGQRLAYIDSGLGYPNAYASFEAWVVRENQTGTLDFYYHPYINPTAADPSFYNLSLILCAIGDDPYARGKEFLGYTTSVAYLLDSPGDLPPGIVDMPPGLVDRDQNEIDFLYATFPFSPPPYTGDETLYPSPTLLIQTNARYFRNMYSNVVFYDSLTGLETLNLVPGFGPSDVPEPGLYTFLGSLGVIGAAFLRRKRTLAKGQTK